MSGQRLLRTCLLAACLGLGGMATQVMAQANIAAGGTYTENFDSLSNSGTANPWADDTTLTGWHYVRSNGTAMTYRADNGAANAGALYSYGASSTNERALGSIGSGGTGTQCYAVQVKNAGTQPIAGFEIFYTGEQWRNGGNASAHQLEVHYRVVSGASPFAMDCGDNTLWEAIPELNFEGPITGSPASALDGNDPANSKELGAGLVVSLAVGEEIWLRWTDIDNPGADHGLAIDDLIIKAHGGGPQPVTPVISFDAAPVQSPEGNTGDSNTLDFIVNINPLPTQGNPVNFDITVDVDDPARVDLSQLPASMVIDHTSSGTEIIRVNIVGNDVVDGDSQVVLNLSNITGANSPGGDPLSKEGTILDDDVAPIATREIFEIQGNGMCSPFVPACDMAQSVGGEKMRTADNIVTAIGSNGFFIQTPDARDDGDSMTSNGIFVYTSPNNVLTDDAQAIAVGDEITVVGRITEYRGMTQIVVAAARDAENSVLRTAAGQPLPEAVDFGENGIPSKDPDNLSCGESNFECFEGMRVRIRNGAVAASNQRRNNDPYAEVFVSPYGERGVREKGVLFGKPVPAGSPAAGNWDGNPEIIELDADHLNAIYAGELVGGTRFEAEGVIGYDFGDYEFWPSSFTVLDDSNVLPRPVPEANSDELTIGSFNAFRLCDAVAGNTQELCAPTAALETNAARVTHQLGQISAYIREVLNSPDVLAMQEVENIDILNQLATQITTDGGPSYRAYLLEGNDVGGIDVGYLVNSARVENVQVTQLAGMETWDDPNDTSAPSLLHDRPPLLLRGNFTGSALPYEFLVLNNHTRSRTGLENDNDQAQRNRAKRFTQAVSIANLVQGLQTHSDTAALPLFLVGDYNAYQFTDGYADVVGLIAGTYVNDENSCTPANGNITCKLPNGTNIVNPPLSNAVLLLDEQDQYSYNFTENFGNVQGYWWSNGEGRDMPVNQVLDHALFNHVAEPHVTGMAYGRANVDASAKRFRDCNYRYHAAANCPQGPGTWVPVGSSDHDGLVLYVTPPKPDPIFSDDFED